MDRLLPVRALLLPADSLVRDANYPYPYCNQSLGND